MDSEFFKICMLIFSIFLGIAVVSVGVIAADTYSDVYKFEMKAKIISEHVNIKDILEIAKELKGGK